MNTPLELLEIDAATMFVAAPSGRILRENDPDQSPAPRLFLAGCREGNILRLRGDVDDDTAQTLAALAADEPALDRPDVMPRFVQRYRALLSINEAITEHNFCLIHRLPHRTRGGNGIAVVAQGTPVGDALRAKLVRHGLPKGLVDLGFVDLSHFWEPWCVALAGDDIAALAFAARLGDKGAEIGVVTLPPFRGRGYAAAATAAWSALPMLQERALFYSTHRDNLSSQRVIARLGLPFLGVSMRLG